LKRELSKRKLRHPPPPPPPRRLEKRRKTTTMIMIIIVLFGKLRDDCVPAAGAESLYACL
jgi:hypothetical protein